MTANKYAYRVTVSALCLSTSIILCRFLGFSPEYMMLRFEMGILPIVLVAHLYGAPYAGFCYLGADLLGALVMGQAINPLIALCKCLIGVLLGFFFHQKKLSLLRSTVALSFIAVVCEFFIMLGIFYFYFGFPFLYALWCRVLTAGLNLPVRILCVWLLGKLLVSPRGRIFYEHFKDKEREKKRFLTYAHSFQTVTKPGLSRISALLARLGNPESKLSCIHVAGTNGKGSVCAYLTAALTAEGKRVGTFTSPNLISPSERICISGKEIDRLELGELLTSLAPVVADAERELGEKITQFEIWTAAAFLYFAKMECDYVVLEVGMGGAFDATNAITHNAAACFTRIDLDHTEYLGDTVAEIAKTKAGIMKSESQTGRVFTVPQMPEVEAELARVAQEKGLALETATPLEAAGRCGIYELAVLGDIPVTLALGGIHQRENAALAASVLRALGVSENAIREGLTLARHRGRMEILREDPMLLYDGAHNENGVRALIATVDEIELRPTVIFACMKDKKIENALRLLASRAKRMIFTTVSGNERAESAADLQKRAAAIGITGETAETLPSALAMLDDGESAVICGSLYLYADLPAQLIRTESEEKVTTV